MNEKIEYAEMLEIPVSTVNVVRKKRRKKSPAPLLDTPIKESVIEQINHRLDDTVKDNPPVLEEKNPEPALSFDDVPERIDTVRLFADEKERKSAFENEYSFDNSENDGGRYELNENSRAQKAVKVTLGTEFALACALCGAIFLTNVFLPSSAINTFFRAVHAPAQAVVADNRVYSDFTLSPVVSDLSSATLALSDTGVLSFQDKCCVYPAADGEVLSIMQSTDGSFVIKLGYSDTFTGVFSGLNQVYYAVGDIVKCNVPFGYCNGENPVQVTMYSDGVLLNDFVLTEENCLAWLEE